MIKLLNVPAGACARLVSVDETIRPKLKPYGLYAGDQIYVLRVAPLDGPLLVKVNGREIALGRVVAEKIFVEVECE